MSQALFPDRPRNNSLLREWTGPLTEDLVLSPSRHGLDRVPKRFTGDGAVETVCGYCSTGCSLRAHMREGEAVNLSVDPNYPVNQGLACPKGWEALTVLNSGDRSTVPLLRDSKGTLQEASWDEALKAFVGKFKMIKETFGPDSLAWLGTGQITVEELAYLGALGRFGMGIRHGDGNTRQCMATSVVAYKQSFGFDAPPYTYQDFEDSDTLIFVGANPCIAHPIMWQRVMRNRNRPEIIVLDPRKTETAEAASQHYALRPKSDLQLFYCLGRMLIERDCVDERFIDSSVEGFDEYKAFVQDFSIEETIERTGLAYEEVERLATSIERGKRVSFWWTMGVNQNYEGVRLAQSIINLALITGNIGQPGTGANSITGQCNAMGSRLFANTSSLIGGYDFVNPDHRSLVSSRLGIEESYVPSIPGWSYDQIVDQIEAGVVKGLWIVATNSAHSWIDQDRLRRAFEKLEFLVVQDMYCTTETAAMADLVLPAAGWGEKEGTFINSERRIGRTRKVRQAPSEALADFSIFRLVSRYWGDLNVFDSWSSPENIFKILAKLTEGRPCDISGIGGYEMLEEKGGIQWPYPSDYRSDSVQRRLFEDGKFYHPNGKAKLIFERPCSLPEEVDENYPFVMLSGRGTSAQWHTQTRTSKSDVLRKLYPKDVYFEINPEDASNLQIQSGTLSKIASRRASIVAKAMVTSTVRLGQIFVSMHYQVTNKLTHASFDLYSKQPSYKYCAVSIRKYDEN